MRSDADATAPPIPGGLYSRPTDAAPADGPDPARAPRSGVLVMTVGGTVDEGEAFASVSGSNAGSDLRDEDKLLVIELSSGA